MRTYVVHCLQILGEAAFKLPPEIRAQYDAVPWSRILGMRHILVHDYFRIDPDIVWAVVEKDLPDLKPKLESMLREMV
ncbi:MAG: hypothetical protein BWY10_00829 [Chloroflexi bacterium ADurb.Bin180]|nr:MAG: hypothetical protein BWY10_00829 [Chloroflexi bacterium ADurb.Bin180]